MRKTLLSLTTLFAACTAESTTTFEDPRVNRLIESGALELDLSAAPDDPTVVHDAIDLATRALDLTPELELGAGRSMKLRYLGKGQVTREIPHAPPSSGEGEPSNTALTFDAFNASTNNEFRIELPDAGVTALRTTASARGTDTASFVAQETAPSLAWSNDDDDRFRMYGLNAAVTNPVHRPIVRLGGDVPVTGCSGTMIGPRHILTAGHCIWSRTKKAWSTGFTARVGRNGSSWIASVLIDNQAEPPPGEALWYWTPSQYRNNDLGTDGYDLGILVVPSRIGDASGWMGRVALGSAQLADRDIFRRGYPICNHPDRIDDPVDCDPHHLYGNLATCDLGNYGHVDADGWSRTVRHSCDASAGDSGSPLYMNSAEGNPSVTAVHYASLCGTTNDNECSESMTARPLRATRLTPEYLGWISYFRSTFP